MWERHCGVVQGVRTRMGREPFRVWATPQYPECRPIPMGSGAFGAAQHPKSPRHTSPYLRTRVFSQLRIRRLSHGRSQSTFCSPLQRLSRFPRQCLTGSTDWLEAIGFEHDDESRSMHSLACKPKLRSRLLSGKRRDSRVQRP